MQLFFGLGAVQTLPVWILADSGSVSNLTDETVFNRLPFKPPIKDPGDVRVIGGNGETLECRWPNGRPSRALQCYPST